MTDFQITLVMFCIGWCSGGVFMTLLKLIKMDKKLDEILKEEDDYGKADI